MVRTKNPAQKVSLLPGIRARLESRKHPHSKPPAMKSPRFPNSIVSTGKLKKKRRWHPGTAALREIRKIQKGTNLLIERAPFERVVREIIQDICGSKLGLDGAELGTMRITKPALQALHESAEKYLIDYLSLANSLSIHAGRKTLMPRDTKLAAAIQAGKL